MNTRGQTSLTKTGILFVVIIFYVVIITFIGYINAYFNYDTAINQDNVNNSGFFSFLGLVITGIVGLPVWINTILFGSLTLILSWIILSSLPTFNGGG